MMQIMTSMSILLGTMAIVAALYDMLTQCREGAQGEANVIYAPRECFLPCPECHRKVE